VRVCVCVRVCTCVRAHVCRAVCVCVCVAGAHVCRAPGLGRMCVVLQVLVLLQVLGQVLGPGPPPSPLITVHPPTKLYFRQSRATPEPENKYIFNDTGTTPEGQTRYLPGMISKRYGTQLSGRVVPSVLPRCALRLTTLCLMSCHFVPSVLPRALRLTALCLASYRVMPNVLPLCA